MSNGVSACASASPPTDSSHQVAIAIAIAIHNRSARAGSSMRLIGTAFRRSLQAVLWTSQEREDLGVLMTEHRRQRRLPAYLEIGDYSFEKYLLAFVLPYHRDHLHTVSSVEDLAAKNDLRAIEGSLRGNGKLRVFANHNDFLTSDQDIEWLKGLIGPQHFRLFPAGGHLGNLNRPEVQTEVMNSLSDLIHSEVGNR